MESVTKTTEGIIVTHGYARCSTNETRQDIDRQVRELRAAGATRIWMEYEHGDAPTKEQQDMMWDTVHVLYFIRQKSSFLLVQKTASADP